MNKEQKEKEAILQEEILTEPSENQEETAEKSGKTGKKKETKADIEKETRLLNIKISDLEKELQKKTEELDDLNDRYLRMAAEYDNFRKRVQKEKSELYSDAVCDTVKSFLPVLDNLERASQSVEGENQNIDAVKEGLSKILKQFFEILEKSGVTEISGVGEKFDPLLHNAVMHEEDSEKEESIITEVFQKGYKLGDKVIRHSVVKVVN